MMTQISKPKAAFIGAFVLLMVLGMGMGVATHAASSGTTILVTPSGGATFQNTGWTPQSYTVNTAGVQGDQQVVITVTGTTSTDSYARYLVVSVNGHVLNAQALTKGSFSGGIGGYYSDIVSGSFSVTYDITPYVQGVSSSTVLIGLTTQSGSWNVQGAIVGNGAGQSVVVPSSLTGTQYVFSTAEVLAALGVVFAVIAGILYETQKHS
ncbi:MAG: hypothetical protein JRN26_04595 [Nitrososphaerota archaeon]|jgi:hypothetical protein|nr:hypothetical protein [Nitrososphaerota archaeon]MDG6927863.1 hypothetical protein [Nitrososphaerota archaeon]MDG6932158.1 hypothetical protein [Nitrososphaerota archaeon]MDG6936143.1 hypothetical protein [Nitrososphaerota archaeon]MDG6944045.1 hypothetical protein [Nitrososphaerota archaeon]